MNDRNLVRGLFLMAISLAFGAGALRYPIGSFSRAGAGLFPLLVSGLLFVIAVTTMVRSRLVEPVRLNFDLKGIGLITLSLCGLTVISKVLDMAAGIAFMVFVASLAGTSHAWRLNLQICAGLIAIAFGFQHLLGLDLPLF